MKIEEVKQNLGKIVEYNGAEYNEKKGVYKLTACIFRKNEAGFFYQAELLDTKHGASVLICKLENVRALQ